MEHHRSRFSVSPATVISIVALFVALGGSAYALKGKNTVNSGDIKNNQVKGRDVKNGSLLGKDVKDGTLVGDDILDGSLGAAELGEGSVGATKLAPGSVGTAALANNGVKGADVDESSLELSASDVPGTARPFALRLGPDEGPTAFVSRGGITLALSCSADGSLTVTRANDSGILSKEDRMFDTRANVVIGSSSGGHDFSFGNNGAFDQEYLFRRDSDGRVTFIEVTLATGDIAVGDDCLAMGYTTGSD